MMGYFLPYYRVLRPKHPKGAWGEQIVIGLILWRLGLSIGPKGGAHELRLHWAPRYESILTVRWWSTKELCRRWGIHGSELWLGPCMLRLGHPLASLWWMLTQGSDL